jgi:hypothetical protein
MSRTDPATLAWLDQDRRRTASVIRQHGVQITYVSDDTDCCDACRANVPKAPSRGAAQVTSFAYTVGLFGIGHPELLVFSLDQGDAAAVLNDAARHVRSTGDLTPGDLLTWAPGGRRVLVEAVPNPGEIAFAANEFFRRPREASVALLQLSYADERGRFPDHPQYSLAAGVQPRPGRFRA